MALDNELFVPVGCEDGLTQAQADVCGRIVAAVPPVAFLTLGYTTRIGDNGRDCPPGPAGARL
jgi:hypothetical protein